MPIAGSLPMHTCPSGVRPSTVPSMFLHTASQRHTRAPGDRSQKFQDSSCTLIVGDLGRRRKGRGYQGGSIVGNRTLGGFKYQCLFGLLLWALWLCRDPRGRSASPPALTRAVNRTSLVPTTSAAHGSAMPEDSRRILDGGRLWNTGSAKSSRRTKH